MWFTITVLVIGFWAFYSWKAWHVPKNESVPTLWRTMAYRHPDAADALRIRKALVEAIAEEEPPELGPLLPAVDAIVDAIAQLCRARSTNSGPDDVCRAAIALLVELDALRLDGRLTPSEHILHRLRARYLDLAHGLEIRGLSQSPSPEPPPKTQKNAL